MKEKKIINILILIIVLYSFYLDKNVQINNQTKLTNNETKITVIIPIYNGGKYLNYSLRSVQKQKMKEIEIIIVDDNSNDDSLEIIQNYMKNDKRIKLIKNDENRRILYSKSIGVLNSKGKYIIELDQDDVFIEDDAFNILYEESEKYKIDILNFGHVDVFNNTEFKKKDNLSKRKKIILKRAKFKSVKFKMSIYLLWGNLIKADLYKKVIYNLWPIIINYKIIFQEDFLITFFFLFYAEKYEKIKNVFYYHLMHKNSASSGCVNNSEFYLSFIFTGIIYYDYHIDFYSQDIQLLIKYINDSKEDLKKAKTFFPTLFNFFFRKIILNDKLLEHHKKKLLTDFNISENCESYLFLDENQSFNMKGLVPKKFDNYLKNERSIKLSIIIVCSNYEKIIKIINSINSQNYEYLEIILIYDDEDKKNYKFLNNHIRSYSHIKLIENEIKRGTVFSISKGVMIAKGKYLLILNQNCYFISNNTIQNIYEEIENDDADIFEFNLYKIFHNNCVTLYKCKHFDSEFNLTKIKHNLKFDDIDIKNELLTNKLFRATYFKRIIKHFNLNKIHEIIDYYYNHLFTFIFESSLHKYKHLNSINLFMNDIDFDKIKFNDFTLEENKKINEIIFYINFIFDNSKNTYESKESVLKEFFNFLSIIYNKFTKISQSSLKLLDKFIYSKYISKSNKILLKNYFNSLIH